MTSVLWEVIFQNTDGGCNGQKPLQCRSAQNRPMLTPVSPPVTLALVLTDLQREMPLDTEVGSVEILPSEIGHLAQPVVTKMQLCDLLCGLWWSFFVRWTNEEEMQKTDDAFAGFHLAVCTWPPSGLRVEKLFFLLLKELGHATLTQERAKSSARV